MSLRTAVLLLAALSTVAIAQDLRVLQTSVTCGSGKYKKSNRCYDCPSQCATCTSSSSCQSCRSGYYLSYSSCKSCTSYCSSCSSGTCTACSSGYTLSDGVCKSDVVIVSNKKIADGGIAGIVIGAVALVIIIICVICCCTKKTAATGTVISSQTMGGNANPTYSNNQQGFAPAQNYNPSPVFNNQPYVPPPVMMNSGPQQGGWAGQSQPGYYPPPPMGSQPAGFGMPQNQNPNGGALPPGFASAGYQGQAPNGAPLPPGFNNAGPPMVM